MPPKDDAYGSILVSNQERRVSIPKWDVERVNKISSQEFCSDASDVVKSKTVERILNMVGTVINRGKTWDEQEDMENIIGLYDKVFKKGSPISKKEQKALLDFFSFFRKDVLVAWNTLLSKISILQSDDNKAFIRRFLEDGKSGNYTGLWFINHIWGAVFKYSLVVDIDIFGGENIEYIDSIEGIGKLYFYKDSTGSYRIFLIKEANEIVYFKEKFTQIPRILKNGLIFWAKEREVDDENRNVLPDIMDESEDIQYSSHSQIWTLYKFDSKTDVLEEIYKKEWIVSVEKLDAEYGFFQTMNESDKKGVIKVMGTDTNEWKISEILQELYDNIYMWPDGFIVTERQDEEMQEDSTIAVNTIVRIHAEAWDDSVWLQDKLTGKTLLGEQGVLWDMPWSEIKNHNGFNRVQFYDSTNICSIWTVNGRNCYILNKDQPSVTPIYGLQWLQTTVGDDFFSGVPTLVKENGKIFLKAFIKETNTVRNLVEFQSNTFPTIEITENIVRLGFYGIGEECFYFHKGKLYDLKKWFLLKDLEIYEKRLFRFSKNTGVSFYDEFGTIHTFLEEVRPGTIISVR